MSPFISLVLLVCASQNALSAGVYLLKEEPPRLTVEKLYVPLSSIKKFKDILPYPEYISDRRYKDAYLTTKRLLDALATYEGVTVQPVLQEEVPVVFFPHDDYVENEEEMMTRNLPIEEANEADNNVEDRELAGDQGVEDSIEEEVSKKKHKKKSAGRRNDDDGKKSVKLFKKPRKEVEKIQIAQDTPVKNEYEFALGSNNLKVKIPLPAFQ